MANDNETFNEVFTEAMNRNAVRNYRMGISNGMKIGAVRCTEDVVDHYAMRFRDAHRRDREAARRRAERSAIYNMLESFPRDWDCNPGAVRKWMAAWYKNADDLCEGGPYAEQ